MDILWENIIVFVFFPLSSFLLSMGCVYKLIKILPQIGLLDVPGGRHVHESVTPKGEG